MISSRSFGKFFLVAALLGGVQICYAIPPAPHALTGVYVGSLRLQRPGNDWGYYDADGLDGVIIFVDASGATVSTSDCVADQVQFNPTSIFGMALLGQVEDALVNHKQVDVLYEYISKTGYNTCSIDMFVVHH